MGNDPRSTKLTGDRKAHWHGRSPTVPVLYYKVFSDITRQISETFALATKSNLTRPIPENHKSNTLSKSKTPTVSMLIGINEMKEENKQLMAQIKK